MTQLLVSVRSAVEAAAALAGGATIIDVKEPAHGSLGRAADSALAEVVAAVGELRPVSAALGELAEGITLPPAMGLSFVKAGLAQAPRDWPERLLHLRAVLRDQAPACRLVPVAYADWRRAGAPPPAQVVAFAREHHYGVLLIDTWRKDGTTLRDWLSMAELTSICQLSGLRVALAGSLGIEQMRQLRQVAPAWFAVRGAVCRDGRRDAAVVEERVRRLILQLHDDA